VTVARVKPLYCCNLCGRDTSARGGICARCLGGRFAPGDEGKGRKSRLVTNSMSPHDDTPDDDPTPTSTYHGETTRDDI
jgi:hypothetical protein